jgi:hypothetical protein
LDNNKILYSFSLLSCVSPTLALMPHPQEEKGMIENTFIYKKHNTPALNKIGLNQQYSLAVLPCNKAYFFIFFLISVISLAGTSPVVF